MRLKKRSHNQPGKTPSNKKAEKQGANNPLYPARLTAKRIRITITSRTVFNQFDHKRSVDSLHKVG